MLFSSATLWEQNKENFSVEIALSKTTLSLDEKLEVSLILIFPNTHFPDIDTIRMNLLKYVGLGEPPFALEEESIEEEVIPKNETTKKTLRYLLEPQLPGFHFISLYQIPFLPLNQKEKPVEIISTIFPVEVTIPVEKGNIKALTFPLLSLTDQFPIIIDKKNQMQWINNKDLVEKERALIASLLDKKAFPWAQLTGFLLILCIILIAQSTPKKEKRKKRIERVQFARKRALHTLDKLLIPEKEYQQFYTQLADIVRHYTEESFQIKTSTQTTQEFLYHLSSLPDLNASLEAEIIHLMQTSDRIKFAFHVPNLSECEEAQKSARLFIERIGSTGKRDPQLFQTP